MRRCNRRRCALRWSHRAHRDRRSPLKPRRNLARCVRARRRNRDWKQTRSCPSAKRGRTSASSPVMPQNAAGWRMEPPVSVPVANGDDAGRDRCRRSTRRAARNARRIPGDCAPDRRNCSRSIEPIANSSMYRSCPRSDTASYRGESAFPRRSASYGGTKFSSMRDAQGGAYSLCAENILVHKGNSAQRIACHSRPTRRPLHRRLPPAAMARASGSPIERVEVGTQPARRSSGKLREIELGRTSSRARSACAGVARCSGLFSHGPTRSLWARGTGRHGPRGPGPRKRIGAVGLGDSIFAPDQRLRQRMRHRLDAGQVGASANTICCQIAARERASSSGQLQADRHRQWQCAQGARRDGPWSDRWAWQSSGENPAEDDSTGVAERRHCYELQKTVPDRAT